MHQARPHPSRSACRPGTQRWLVVIVVIIIIVVVIIIVIVIVW